MREATPPWRFPPASRAGTGAGPWRRPERRIGKPGEIRRRKVTGLMSQSVPMGPRAHAAPAGRGGRGGAGKRRRLCPPGRSAQSGLCGDDVRRTAGGKLWETIGRKGWTFPAEAPRKLHGAPWQVRGMVARPPDPLCANIMSLKTSSFAQAEQVWRFSNIQVTDLTQILQKSPILKVFREQTQCQLFNKAASVY